MMKSARIKRIFDVFSSVFLIVIFSPVMFLGALAIWIADGSPVVFCHLRVGRGSILFPCMKFRTMAHDADHLLKELLETSPAAREEWEKSRKLRDDPRIVPIIGEIMRKTSVDELPQLFNVLRGEMSMVGPRPIVMDEAHYYGADFSLYCSVRPGLTGPWQIGGRSDITYEERVMLDVNYIKTRNVFLDVAICFKTALVVLMRRGAC